MATPQEKLAESLEALKALQDRHVVAIRARDLSRTHRERLLRSGFLREVMKGWYIPARPGEQEGDSTAWYASFWDFCAAYLRARFGEDWCLSPEQSLSLHAGNRAVPAQLLVRTPKGGNKPTALLHGTSIFDMRLAMPRRAGRRRRAGRLRLFSLPAALHRSVARLLHAARDRRAHRAGAPCRRFRTSCAVCLRAGTARSPGALPARSAISAATRDRRRYRRRDEGRWLQSPRAGPVRIADRILDLPRARTLALCEPHPADVAADARSGHRAISAETPGQPNDIDAYHGAGRGYLRHRRLPLAFYRRVPRRRRTDRAGAKRAPGIPM